MKPARSPAVTSVFATRSMSASASRTTDGSVTTVLTTSTRPMTGAGLNQCMPRTRPGRCVATASSVTDSAEAFVARIVSGGSDLVVRGEPRRLEAEPLGDRLDDELGLAEVGEGRRRRDASEHGGALVL